MQTSVLGPVLQLVAACVLSVAIGFHGWFSYSAAAVPTCSITTDVQAHGRVWRVEYRATSDMTNAYANDARISAAKEIGLAIYSVSDPNGHLAERLRANGPYLTSP